MPSNKRLIPRGKEFMGDKKVCDLTYSKLQVESNWKQGDPHRYIYKNKINLSQWERELGISRQTIKKRIEYLKEAGLIKDEGEFYMLEYLEEYKIYIPEETLRILTNSMKKDTVKIYAFLGGWYKYKKSSKQGNYNFTKEELIDNIGLKKGNTTLEKVNDILFILNKLGLIKTKERQVVFNGVGTTQLILLEWRERL